LQDISNGVLPWGAGTVRLFLPGAVSGLIDECV
jgi:hypothetical protein